MNLPLVTQSRAEETYSVVGARERVLMMRRTCKAFAPERRVVSQTDLQTARKADEADRYEADRRTRALLEKIVSTKENVGFEFMAAVLKETVEIIELATIANGGESEQVNNMLAIRESVIKTVRSGAKSEKFKDAFEKIVMVEQEVIRIGRNDGWVGIGLLQEQDVTAYLLCISDSDVEFVAERMLNVMSDEGDLMVLDTMYLQMVGVIDAMKARGERTREQMIKALLWRQKTKRVN
jgi:hypothetical protein